MKITYCHIIYKIYFSKPIYIVMQQDHKIKFICGYLCMIMPENVYVIIFRTVNNTPINIIEKIYTHSIQGFSKYIKLNLLQSYKENCTIYDCYICSRS